MAKKIARKKPAKASAKKIVSRPKAKPTVPAKTPVKKLGDVRWTELNTTNDSAALSFYQKLFGWKSRPMDMGPQGIYHIISQNGKDIGGITKIQNPNQPTGWLTYFYSDNVDESNKEAEALGGKTLMPPTEIPGANTRMAIMVDPTGVMFALVKD
ncbi:MAG: VOC family protein [Leptospira sp.]|nr:VOC family protein [Leptospira sp.]